MQCPYCGVTLRHGAKKCPVCGGWQPGAAPAGGPAPATGEGPPAYSNMAAGLTPAYSNHPAKAAPGTAAPAVAAPPAGPGPAAPIAAEGGTAAPVGAAAPGGEPDTPDPAQPPGQPAPAAPAGNAAGPATAGSGAPTIPLPKKAGARRWLRWVVPAALLVVAAGVIALVFALRPAAQDPKQALRQAVEATGAAWADSLGAAARQLDPADILAGLYTGPATVEFSVGLPLDMNALLPGIGADGADDALLYLSGSATADLPARRANIAFTAGPGGLLQGSLALEDDLVALELPALYAGSHGLRTETLGADYQASNAKLLADMLGGFIPGWREGLEDQFNALMAEDLAFNLFDLLPPAPAPRSGDATAEATRARLAPLADALWEPAQVTLEKQPQALTLGGQAVECQVYTAQVQGPALAALVNAAAQPLLAGLTGPTAEQLFALAGQAQALQAARQMGADALTILEDRLAGPAVLTVRVAEGGAVQAEIKPQDDDFEITLQAWPAGAPSRLRLLAAQGGQTLLDLDLELALDPALAPGGSTPAGPGSAAPAARDITLALSLAAQVQAGAPAQPMLEAALTHRPGQALDNFSATLASPAAGFEAAASGTLHLDHAAGALRADLYDIALTNAAGTGRYALAVNAAPAPEHLFQPVETTLVLDMGLFEMGLFAYEISRNLGRLGLTG